MEKDSLSEKAPAYLVKNPCKPLEPCSYEDDYDPCESSDDITEKDLAILLREEAAKLQKKQGGSERDDTNLGEDSEDVDGADSKIKWEDEKKKKKICKNVIKNPFFTNPLKFSSDLPPPPLGPPPQFLPLTETDSSQKVCEKKESQKSKKKKTCKKKELDVGLEVGPKVAVAVEVEVEVADTTFSVEADDKGAEADVEDEADEDQIVKGDKEDKKKRCKKRSERPVCRKKVSDISISLLPPQIPPLQRDLPLQSPKDIPEVERQVLMACGARPDQRCKKKKEKTKLKRNS